jgi:RNA polymerase sigma-70 factor, ECF subfamily
VDEKSLVLKAQEGNKHAMNKLLQDNYKALYGFTLKMTANQHLTEDIIQEVCLKAVINIKKFKCNSKFQSWLISIAINYYRDLVRKNKRIEYASEEELINLKDDNIENILDKLQVQEVLLELSKLSYEKRISFILKHYYGYTYDEIARILGCSEGTTKSRIFYTISNLKKKLIGSEVQ